MAQQSETGDSIEEGVRILAYNLQLATKYSRGAILFAAYRDENTRTLAEQALVRELDERGLQVRRVHLPLDDRYSGPKDLPLWIQWNPPAEDEVIFVYDLPRAFPDVLGALNYRRELFTEQGWRVLFWVREEDLGRIAREAPDFWAFRNQVVEFLETQSPDPGV